MAADNLARKAISIPATQAPENIQLRVAAYCQVSSDSEDQKNSFAAQNAYYTALITGKENWTLVDIYADEGITGTSAKKCPDFQLCSRTAARVRSTRCWSSPFPGLPETRRIVWKPPVN